MFEEGSRYLVARKHIQELCAEKPETSQHIYTGLQQIIEILTLARSCASSALHQERETIDGRIRNFVYSDCAPFLFFKEKGWSQLTFPELVAVSKVIGHEANLAIDREAKRRKPVLFKWLDDNWEQMKEYAEKIELHYDNQ
jgi:hypothetical protein